MRTLIFIAGMGRSGTSALTKLISLAGAVLPNELLAASPSNPTGHWECAAAIRLNEAVLTSAGSSWFDPGLRLQVDPLPPGFSKRFSEDIKRMLERELSGDGIFVIKDPRIPALFQHWLAAARDAGFDCRVAHIYRDPEEVAASLAARDRLPRVQSYLLWAKYNLLGERYSRNWPRGFLSYDGLLRDWRSSLAFLFQTLSLDLNLPDEQSVATFLSPALRHHTVTAPTFSDPTPGLWADRIYRLLRDSDGKDIDADLIDDIYDDFVRFDRNRRASMAPNSWR